MIPAALLYALVGLCLGSFAATAAVRLARGEQAIFGRSACDSCGAGLGYLDTLPIVSFVVRRGACGRCGGTIDAVHLAGETAGALILASAALLAPPIRSIPLAALGLVLLTSAIVDAKTRRLPDALTLAAALICTILAAERSLAALGAGLVAAGISLVLLEVVRRGFLSLRGQPGLGFGDVKLVAALAIWLGPLTPWAVALACVLGLVSAPWRRSPDGRMAFGPALAIGGWVTGMIAEAHLWPAL